MSLSFVIFRDIATINAGGGLELMSRILSFIEYDDKCKNIQLSLDHLREEYFNDIISETLANRNINTLVLFDKNGIFGAYMKDNFTKFRNCAIRYFAIYCDRMYSNSVDYICHIIDMGILTSLTIGGRPDTFHQKRIVRRLQENFDIIFVYSARFDDPIKEEIQQIVQRNANITKKQINKCLLDCAIALVQIQLPPYVILEIFDWTIPFVDKVHHGYKINLIQKVYDWYFAKKVNFSENLEI